MTIGCKKLCHLDAQVVSWAQQDERKEATNVTRPRFLIVDDDALSRFHLSSLLSESGDCDTVSNGREAIEAFSQAHGEGRPYDVVFLDVMMPGTDGQATLRAIRESEALLRDKNVPSCRVIMISSSRDPGDVVESFRNRCDGFLNKPISKEQVSTICRGPTRF